MASFFEKLKKGMGIEIVEEEPEKTEKTEEKPPKQSKLPAGQAKPSLKKRKIKKIEIETDLINTETEKTGAEEPKKPEPREPEEKIEEKKEIKKISLAKIAQGKEGKSSSSPFATARVKEEKKLESNRQGFTLQNLSAQEGQLAVDVYQTDAELVIQSTIAGVKTENLDISIEADTVLIRGNRNEPPEQGEKNYFYQECYWGPFSRQIILPEETDPSRAEAVMKEGILTIRIPKIEREKKRKITVKE